MGWGEGSFGIDVMVVGVGEEGEEEEEEAEEKQMNKEDVYFSGWPCSVHLKIGFVGMDRVRERQGGK